MLYEYPLPTDEVRQGDIFLNIPSIAFQLSEGLSILEPDKSTKSITWQEIVSDEEKDIVALLGVIRVPAIVISQTCDIQKEGSHVTLCEIVPLSKLTAFKSFDTQQPKKQVDFLIRSERKMHGFFYLPPDPKLGFNSRMAVEFGNTIRLPSEDLDLIKQGRKGRLNTEAYEHFREKMANYFRRYAFNEWYMLNGKEVELYKYYEDVKANKLYDWQK
jgi:hypothetical protein